LFDVGTGLLVRRYTESDTPLGKLPLQLDYEDYREVDGIKTAIPDSLVQAGPRLGAQARRDKAKRAPGRCEVQPDYHETLAAFLWPLRLSL